VRSGEALIGVASAFSLLKAQTEKPDLKVIGVIYQNDPTVPLSLMDPAGKGKFNLTKKTIQTDEGGIGAVLSLIRETPYKKSDLEIESGYPSLFALLDKKADWVTGRNVFEDPRLERYRDFFRGVVDEKKGLVGLSIFTTQQAYKQNRELIKNLLKSTFHGFENSVFQTESTAESVIGRDQSLSFKELKRVLKDNSLFIKDSHGIIGSINPAAWQELSQLAVEKGFLETAPNLDQFFPEEAKRVQEP
jgi:hypothetical protein